MKKFLIGFLVFGYLVFMVGFPMTSDGFVPTLILNGYVLAVVAIIAGFYFTWRKKNV